MMRLRPRSKRRGLGALVLAATLTSSGFVVGTAADAQPARDGGGTATVQTRQNSRSITPNQALPFPTGQTVGTPPADGVDNPELRGEPAGGDQATKARASDPTHRSLSPRPSGAAAAQRSAAASNASVPTVTPTAVTTSAPQVTRTFNGLDLFDQRFANGGNQFTVEPPDQGLCVGNGFVLETVNDVLQVFSPAGAALSPVTDLNTFYGYPAQFDRTTGVQGPFVTDPSCLYDAGTQRWFHLALTLDVDPASGALLGTNHLDLAVSKTSSPLGAWNLYVVPVQDDGTDRTPVHKDCPCVGDYPHVGADAHGFYVTTNEYPFSSDPGQFGNNFDGAQLYVFSKDALAAGQVTNVIQLETLTVGSGKTRKPGFTVWPAQSNPGQFATVNNGTEYFLSSNAAEEALGRGISNTIVLWSLQNTDSLNTATPHVSLHNSVLSSEDYGVPPFSEQKLGSVPLRDCLLITCLPGIGPSRESEGPLDSGDSRMYQVWYAGGKVYGGLGSLMTVSGELKAGAAWFTVDPTGTGAITNQGYVGVTGGNVDYPSIAVTPDGSGAMALTLAGRDWFPSASYVSFAGGAATGPVRVASQGRGPQDGFSEYNFFGPPVARPRWGDYGAAVTDGSSLWLATEYIGQTCTLTQYSADPTCGGTRGVLANWGTRITRLH